MAILKKNNVILEKKDTYSDLKKKIRKLQNKITVEVALLSRGEVIFSDVTNNDIYTWNEANDILVLPLSAIYSMLNNAGVLLKKYYLGIIDFYGVDKLTLEDLIKGLGLDDVYECFNYDIGNIDSIITDTSVEDFSEFVEDKPLEVKELLIDRYKYLKSMGVINDANKENIFKNAVDKDYIF